MTLSIYRNGVVVESVTIDDTAKLSQSFMGGNYLNVPLTVTRKLDVLPLDYVFFEGERYTLYDEPESRVFDGMIDYTLIFHAPYFELYNKRYKNLGDLEFDYSGDLVDFLNVLIESMGEESGFTLGTVESIGWQTITFSNKSCYGALVDICKAFEAEFVVSGKEISAGKSLAADTAYTFEYGRGKGLYELKREEIGNSSVVTVLHVFGGTTNVPAGYHVGGKYGRLALPAPLTQNVDIYGVREDEVTFEEIYPRLKDKGLLAVTVPEDIASAAYWRVKLDIDFDLSKCVQPGLTAQLQFRSGELMGITFDLLAGSFDNTTKEVSIIVKEEGDARYPSLTRQPKVGDQFVLLNIDMDDSYLTAAQEELQQKGQEYLDKVSSTQWLYKLTIDPHEYGRRGYVISVGDKIRVKDSRLGFDAKIRVSERTVQLTDPRNIELTISDEVLYSSDERLNHEVSGNSEQVSIHSDDIRAQYLMLKYNEQVLKQIIAAVEPILDVIYYDPDLDAVVTRKDFLSQKGVSAYGLGSTSGSGASGSLGELVNVGQWADEVPTADRVMVQLAGATHWSAKPLADLVGLDTTALAQYLTANSYLKASDISSYLTWANLSGKPTVYPTSWANIADKPTVYPTTWTSVTGRPTKLSQFTDDVVAGNYLPKPTWDAVFEVVTVDGTPALKVKYDILGLKGITAYADGSLSGGFSGALVDLVDVAVTNLASGDILKYNGTHFVNVPVSSIAGASSWDQITGKPEYYPTRWADVSGAPTSLPASDVYPWAKAVSKPTYTAAEVGALALSGGVLAGDVYLGGGLAIRDNTARHSNVIGLLNMGDGAFFTAVGSGNRRMVLYSSVDLYRDNGSTQYRIYDSSNFNPDSKLGVSSVAVEAKKMSYQGLMTAISGTTTFPAGLYLYGVYNNGYPVTYGNLLRVGGSGLGEMLFGWAGDNTSVGGLYYRSKRDVAATAWSNWCKLWTSANSNLSTIDWSANNLNAAANLDVAGQAYVSGWLRSRGNVGWYSQDYGGGIHMTDSTWVRVYGGKGLMIDTGHIGMGQLQITNSGEASIGFRSPSSSSGDWCLGKGVSTIGSGFGLYNAVTNRVAFQIASATDNASFVGSITAPTFVGNLSGSASSVNGYDINSFTGYYKYTIDASSLDQNTYYPVTMYLGVHHTVRISVLVALDSGTKPAWSSHASGYSVRFIEEVNGSGWGTSEVSRNILANEYGFANANPVGRVEQMTNSSTEVIWVRGGGKYFFYLSIPYITPALRTSTFTNASQSVSPRTDTMDLRMAANGNGIAVSKLYAHNSIEINGFTIDVYNGALRVNGNLVATGGVTAYQ